MLLLIILLILIFGLGGPYYGYNNYGPTGGLVPLIILVVILFLIFGGGGLRLR